MLKYIIAAVCLLGFSIGSYAAVPDPSLCDTTRQDASEMSHLRIHGDCPTIKVETDGWFVKTLCKGNTPCPILGVVFNKDPRTIHVIAPESIPTKLSYKYRLIIWRSVVLHEMVHILQIANGFEQHGPISCLMLELQAYQVQGVYLKANGLSMSIPKNVGCGMNIR